jgi:L-fuconolactonase
MDEPNRPLDLANSRWNGSSFQTRMRIDSHQHFWHYSPTEHIWMTDQMAALKHAFLPENLQPLLAGIHFDGCIAVQARQNLEETRWLLELADQHEFIKGVVGWVDLRSEELPQQLERFARHPKLVGVRHLVQDEPDDNFMLRPEFSRGISQLRAFDLTYDLLLFPQHLKAAAQLVEEFPEQPFVLDHIAKPKIAEGLLSPWQEDLRQLAKLPNVTCKLSGMVTEAKWKQWHPGDFHRYLDIVFGAFGWNRLMIGSDWPVCLLSGEYEPVMKIVIDYVQKYSLEAQAAILGENCARFYRIDAFKRGPR